jgi:membrane protein required for colicin V production
VNAADVLILAVLALGMLAGFRRGFVLQVATILGAIVALVIARLEYQVVQSVLLLVLPISAWVTIVSYLIIFFAIWVVIIFLARKVRLLLRLMFLGWADTLGGVVVGLLQGAIMVELLLYLGKRSQNHTIIRLIAHSRLAPAFLGIIPYINQLFPHVLKR